MNRKINIVFIICIFLYLCSGCMLTVLGVKDINNYENRTAYKLPKIGLNAILDKTYQDNTEFAFSDQTLLSSTIKKGYNFVSNSITSELSNFIFKNNCDNKYINLGNSMVTFGCDNNLVYYPSYISYNPEEYEKRIENINHIIGNTDIPLYIYYVEKDTDINFETGEKSDIYNYLSEHINTNNFYKFEINSFDEFNDYFYKTDHHWNHKGSYKAYQELVKILTSEEGLEPIDEVCLNDNFSGSKASYSGASLLYKEQFCAYVFEDNEIDVYIDDEVSSYGDMNYYLENPLNKVTYASFYGGDYGEIIFDNKHLNKDNILIIGESYDNAVLNLLANHFNKTFSIDLRHYERQKDKEFNYLEYIRQNNIDKVLLIGNRDYFRSLEFNMEV